jgi:hypothetical protein
MTAPRPQPDRSPARSLPHLDRRRFLRNVGLCLALPAMESFLPRRLMATAAPAGASGASLAATTATGAPLRSAFLYFPNGAIPDAWWPATEGKDFELSRTLAPLAKVKDKLQVFGGLDDLSANAGPDGGGDHARANATFLTGVRIKKTNGADFRAGVSADQMIARQIGLLTPFRSLELSCDIILNTGGCDTDYACVYQHNLAWSSPTMPLTPEVNPRLLFERLFGAGSPKDRAQNLLARQRQQRSILDFIQDDTRSLTRQLSGRDQQKLDEYLSSVRDIEQRIQAAELSRSSRPQPTSDVPDGIPATEGKVRYGDYVRLMFDMLHLAFQTDSTRVATFMIHGDGSNINFSDIGVNDGHHNLSHHGNKADWMEKVRIIDHWYVQQLAYFLEKMDATKDIDGHSLLHNSQIVYGCGNGDGNRHAHSNLPVLLAGNAGGTLNGGRFTRYGGVPVTNLFLSMMDRIAPNDIARFGDSTGRLANI